MNGDFTVTRTQTFRKCLRTKYRGPLNLLVPNILLKQNIFVLLYRYLEYLFGWANNCLHLAEMLLTTQEQHIGKNESVKVSFQI